MKKIGIKTIKNIIDQNSKEDTKLDFYGSELLIKHQLSLVDMAEFVNSVVGACFDDETNEYMPEAKDFATKVNILKYYTNVDMPEDMSKQYEFVYKLWPIIWDQIFNCIDTEQYYSIIAAIDDKTDEKNAMNEQFFANRIAKLFIAMETLVNNLDAAMSSIDKENLAKVISTISENGIDEVKLVDAVLAHEAKENGGTD